MKFGAFVMYMVHAMLLDFCVGLRRKLSDNGHTLGRFLRFEYEYGLRGVEIFEGVQSGNKKDTVSIFSELLFAQDSIATTFLNILIKDQN